MKKFFAIVILIICILFGLIFYKLFIYKNENKEADSNIRNNEIIEVNQKEIYKKEENNTQNVEDITEFLIKSGENHIEVYEIKGNKEKLIEETEISLDYLSEQDKNILNNGIKVKSKEEVKKVLEDYE